MFWLSERIIMPFEQINFIKSKAKFKHCEPGDAPMFRRHFTISEPISSAIVHVCGLGYAYYYINEQPVTEDLLTAPVSDYRKTLWYNTYDVSNLLTIGENIFAVICGNGWYNEYFKTSWEHNNAPWRDNPKFIMELIVNGKTILSTDDRWKCLPKSPVIYNQLRSGEHFDARIYDPSWKSLLYDDSTWENAITDTTPPTGTFRPCPCEPIRIMKEYKAISIIKEDNDCYVFDFGQNMSGFVRLTVDQAEGDEIVLRYREQKDKNGKLYNHMKNHYPDTECQTDRLICPGYKFTWFPHFTYHGFQYVQISGIKNPTTETAIAVFVHQDIPLRSNFMCSDPYLNKLFHNGIMSTWCNMFYMPTDCPTREKLGWCNDVQASTEQFLTNFASERFLEKYLQDVYDSMLPNGMISAIIPSGGWGYTWGNGPVSEGVLFEVAYRLWLHTGNPKYLIDSLPYFERSLAFYETKTDDSGNITYGLDDHASPPNTVRVDATFINSALLVKFLRITILASELSGVDTSNYSQKLNLQLDAIKTKYLRPDGTCILDKQTAVSMLISLQIYDDLPPLASQLAHLVEENDFHHDCGMVGLPYLYQALNECGLQEYALRIINAPGVPGYREWINDGATTLYEEWSYPYASRNHHMYSDFMSWMMKTIIGIKLEKPAYETISIKPYFFQELSWASGHITIPSGGTISVNWEKKSNGIYVVITIPDGVTAHFENQLLSTGKHIFSL